jgi:hypothetical protein
MSDTTSGLGFESESFGDRAALYSPDHQQSSRNFVKWYRHKENVDPENYAGYHLHAVETNLSIREAVSGIGRERVNRQIDLFPREDGYVGEVPLDEITEQDAEFWQTIVNAYGLQPVLDHMDDVSYMSLWQSPDRAVNIVECHRIDEDERTMVGFMAVSRLPAIFESQIPDETLATDQELYELRARALQHPKIANMAVNACLN